MKLLRTKLARRARRAPSQRRWPAGLGALLRLALLLAVAAGGAPPAARAAGQLAPGGPQLALPRFEPDNCWFALPPETVEGQDVVCGWLVVPEEHGTAGAPTLRLAVAVLRARALRPEPEPVVFVPDRPGAGGIDQLVPLHAANPLRDTRDLIVFDPRGTGHSQPSLDCPEVRAETLAQLAEAPAAEAAAARYNAAALACRQRLVQAGINLSAYNTQEAAADLDDLRRALGYPQLNLYGSGYGTRVAAGAARAFPEGVRGVVLDGVLPREQNWLVAAPRNADAGFTEFFAACTAIARCGVWYRDLERTIALLVDQYNDRPAELTLIDPRTGQNHALALTGDALVAHLTHLMARTDALPILPELVRRLAAGQTAPLENYLAATTFDRGWTAGAYWSVVCAEDGAVNPGPPNVSDLRRWVHSQVVGMQAAFALCQDWRVRALPAPAAPLSSPVPALILNGNFDPLTPAANGDLAATWFQTANNVTFINSGHGSYPGAGDCAIELVEDFYETPGLALDTDCVADTPPVAFVIPSEVVDMPARTLVRDVRTQQPRTLGWLAALSLAAAVLLSALILFPMAWLFGRRETPPELQAALPAEIPAGLPAMPAMPAMAMPAMAPPDMSQAGALLPRAAPWLAVLAGLLLVAMAVLLPAVIDPVITAGAPITWIGLPTNLAWFAALPVAYTLLTVLLVGAAGAGWLSKDWSGRRKLYVALLVLAALAILALLIGVGALTPAWVWLRNWVRAMTGL